MTQIPQWCDHSPRARHPGTQSQMGLWKHHYKQSWWRWWNSSWAISNPKRRCCESAVLNMPENLENSAMATGQEKVSFYSDPKERQCQRMFKLPHNCAHLTHWQSNAQKSLKSGFNSTWTVNFQMFKLDLEKAEEPEVRLPTSVGSLKNQNNARKTSISAVLIMPMPLTV